MDRGIVEAIRDWCKARFQPLGNYAVPDDIPPLTTSLALTEEGVSALDGTVGKTLNDKIIQINNDLQVSGILYKNFPAYRVYVQSRGYAHEFGINSDLNDIITAGAFDCSNTYENIPVTDMWGTVSVLGTTRCVTQIFTSWNHDCYFIRKKYGGKWSDWTKLFDGITYLYNNDVGKTVKELADNMPSNCLLVHNAWSALADYPTKDGGIWTLEILKGNDKDTPKITLSDGKSMFLGYYHIGKMDAVEWRKFSLTKVT